MGMDRKVPSEQSIGEAALSGLSHKTLDLPADSGPFYFAKPAQNGQTSSRVIRKAEGQSSPNTKADRGLNVASVFAHELAQPLTAIANYIQACGATLAPCRGQVPDRAFECIQKALNESERANLVVQRLRTLLDRQELKRTKEDINQVVERSCADLSQLAFEHVVTLDLQLDRSLPRLMIDRVQVQLVIANLVRNSIDALWETPKSRITVRTSPTAADGVRIAVADNGPGLSTRVADHLFQPIASHKPGGMGIGLSICHAIMSAHGGQLSVKSKPDRGTEFHIIFPKGEAVDEQVDNPCRR